MGRTKLNLIFGIFCLFVLSFGAIEVFLIYEIAQNGFSGSKGFGTLMSTGILAGCGKIFLQLVKGNFIDKKSLPMEKLHAFLSTRRKLFSKTQNATDHDAQKELITHTLTFGESVLNGWLPGSHFELSVFVDSTEPLMLCYFDSKHENVARSMAKRRDNPRFYIDNGYEVCKVLQDPSSEPRVISNVHDSGYSFVSDQQKSQIKSTALITIEMETPSVLVVSSNVKDAFDSENKELISFFRVLAEQIRIDLMEHGFLLNIRKQEFTPPQVQIDAEFVPLLKTDTNLDPVSKLTDSGQSS